MNSWHKLGMTDLTARCRGKKRAGEAILLCGRILALVDVYDALRTSRPYKEAWPHDEVVALITNERGQHFDPDVVDAFLSLSGAFESVSVSFQDHGGSE